MEEKVPPNLYTKDYYLTNNIGFEEFNKGLDKTPINYKFRDVLSCCNLGPGKKVLDIGCGRGELVYYSAKSGATALGIDYSSSAIEIANAFKSTLDLQLQDRMDFLNIDALDLPVDEEFDYVFMVEVWEHMYDHQIIPLLQKIQYLLKENGVMILTTPNGFYERYLYPAKHFIEIPFNFIKFSLRMIRGKWKPKSIEDFFRHVFKVKPFRNQFMFQTHVNVSSPLKIRKMLKDNNYEVKIRCWDDSYNLPSLLFSKWAGREMLIIARKTS